MINYIDDETKRELNVLFKWLSVDNFFADGPNLFICFSFFLVDCVNDYSLENLADYRRSHSKYLRLYVILRNPLLQRTYKS